jgi:hypothetical protein
MTMRRAICLLLITFVFACAHTAPTASSTGRMLADDDTPVDTSLAGPKPVALPVEPSPFGNTAMEQDAEAATGAYAAPAQQQVRPQPLPDEPRPPL